MRCWRMSVGRVGRVASGAAEPGGREAGDGPEKVVAAAAGEVWEGVDQGIVARDQCIVVFPALGIAPSPTGEEVITCHTVNPAI